jgi:hypothetical protein
VPDGKGRAAEIDEPRSIRLHADDPGGHLDIGTSAPSASGSPTPDVFPS